ncbi:flagellar motor switch protein FliN [Buchnera aphidicola (Ceratovacuna keduensis)]|uniref:flagellar motor switch protein FliN n=1 Tax=Buchnera aphidicola TaxID=9 RepID=UPI0031B8602B
MNKYFGNFIHVNKVLEKFDNFSCNKKKNIKNFVNNDFNFFNILYANLNNIYLKEKFLLEILFKNFSKILEKKLSNMLHYKIKIYVEDIKIQTYKKYFKNISSLISLNCFKISSIKDFGFFIYSNNFVLYILELFFGGKTNFLNKKMFYNVSYSQNFISNNIKNILINSLSKILKKKLNLDIFSYKFEKIFSIHNENFFSLKNFSAIIFFKVFTKNKDYNTFNICLPLSFIKYINKIIIKKSNKICDNNNLKKNFYMLNDIKFIMSVFLQNFFISLSKLYKLKYNYIIEINNPNDVYVFVGKKLFFLGKNIAFKNNNSIVIKKMTYLKYINSGDKMNNELEKFKKYFSENEQKLYKKENDNKVFSDNSYKENLEKDIFNEKINCIGDIKIKISVRLGSTNIKTKKLLSIRNGSIIQLNQLAGEPLDILANGCLIAKGEIVVIKNKYGIRIVNIINNINNLK